MLIPILLQFTLLYTNFDVWVCLCQYVYMNFTFEYWRGILYVYNGKYNIRCIIVHAIIHPQLDLVDLALPVVERLHQDDIPSEHVDFGVLLPGHNLEELADVRGFLVRRQALYIKDLSNLVYILGLNINILYFK